MSHTLLLNADAQPLSLLPLSTVTWKDAIRLTFLDKVRVIEEYEDWEVHSATQSFKVPSIVMVKSYVKRANNISLTRNNLYLRDSYKCQYCGEDHSHHDLTYDHVLPRAKGGRTEWENIVASCKPCNSKKGSKIIEPLNLPYIPTYWDLIKKRTEIPIIIRHYSWERFLDPKMNVQLIEPSK